MNSMACDLSQSQIRTDPTILHNGNNAVGRLSPQVLQRMSYLDHVPWSESAITNLLNESVIDHDKSAVNPTIDQSSIRFPTTDIYQYDSSSSTSSTSSAPSDESHITIPRSRRVRGQNSTTAPASYPSSPTPSSVKFRNHPSPRTRSQAEKKSVQRPPELSDLSDADTVRLTQAPSDNAGSVKPNPFRAQSRQLSSDMRASSLPHFDSHVKSQPDTLNLSPQTRSIRNKSGQLIKPSLKHAKLPSLTIPTGGGVVQSEPTTPTHSKAVHFDAKLEHVKLFLAKQKPLAVSRDRDPATDTSGTESDFPSFARGLPDDSPETQIELHIRNMPSVPPKGADVVLQGLTLSQSDKTIIGEVRVRNIAYEKWVAARFTLDFWQTTSEVTGHYVESVDDGTFDIFTFSIRLHDMWSRIEEKSMFIALRYSTAGRQIWDNNNGANYMLKFVRKPVARKAPAATEFRMEHSGSKAESARVDIDPSPSLRPSPALTPKASSPARYDSGSAPKIPRSGTFPLLSSLGVRTPTYPTELSNVWSKHTPYRVDKIPPRHTRSVTIGSSRDLEKREQVNIVPSDSLNLDSPFSTPQSRASHERNHHRGYFGRPMGGTPRKTPPGPAFLSPSEEQSPTRGSDPLRGQPSLFSRFTAQNMARIDSASSTASSSSDSSSLSTPLTSSGPGTPTGSDAKPSLGDNYSQFLNQFCFFTGSDLLADHSSGSIPRSHSASDVEAFFSSHSPPYNFSSPLRDLAFNGQRSCSLDSIVAASNSGSNTPRGNPMLVSEL